MLFALILRGVSFEFRSKVEDPRWRRFWDWAFFGGSAVPALLWGVAVANLLKGVPINADFQFTGNFFSLLSLYTVVGGLVTLSVFTLHGAIFLSLKADPQIAERAHRAANLVSWPTVGIVALLVVLSYFYTDLFTRLGVNPGLTALAAGLALIAAGVLVRIRRHGWAFIATGLAIVMTVVTVFRGLYPRVMVSSLNPNWSLTITNASSSPYTLRAMTIVAAIFIPIVLIYQGWTYYVFRGRVMMDHHLEY